MKKIKLIVFFTIICKISFSQNLIPNPSFESDDTAEIFCGVYLPADFNASVDYWITPTNATPDLFSTTINQSCWNYQPNSTYPGPVGIKGAQIPRTGRVMAGIACFSIPGLNQREYVQSNLIHQLLPGNIYYVEFYASLANNAEKYIQNLGAYLSDSPVSLTTDQPLPYVPQITASGFINDTTGWTKISGTFIATSAINYITIGNFKDDNSTTTLFNPGGGIGPGNYGAYYFIDDVSVIDFTSDVNNLSVKQNIIMYPNPFIDKLKIEIPGTNENIISIYDFSSRLILQQTITSSSILDLNDLAKGIYFLEIKTKNGLMKIEKIIKQ